MSNVDLELSFPGAGTAEAGQLAADLQDYLQMNFPDTAPALRREDGNAMDIGTSIALILGTPAVVALARGLADWLKRRDGPVLVLRDKNGLEIIVDKGLSDDAKREIILKMLKR